jgi:hypothetical protein
MNLNRVVRAALLFGVSLVGAKCDIDPVAGPSDMEAERWQTKEERRLKEVEARCGGQPWERLGRLCADDFILPERGSSG